MRLINKNRTSEPMLNSLLDLDQKDKLTFDEALLFFSFISPEYEVKINLDNTEAQIKVPNHSREICISKLDSIKHTFTYKTRTLIIIGA